MAKSKRVVQATNHKNKENSNKRSKITKQNFEILKSLKNN